MELEFRHVFDAAPEALWAALLDPDRVGACVPGMQSVTIISDTEYSARIRVKIAFISAHFDIRTVITEARPPTYLRAVASGEDGRIGSSVKAQVEMHLEPQDGGRTELRVHSQADVLGRLGTLGLNPMRTKAEGMWTQFCDALAADLAGGDGAHRPVAEGTDSGARASTRSALSGPSAASPAPATSAQSGMRPGWLSWLRPGPAIFRAEIDRNGTRVIITCPTDQAAQCLAWLDRQLEAPKP
jgi:carbon monoxide dehydrogenase subunit G